MDKLPELGPLLEEDALLLQAVIKMTDPKTVIEFGYHRGTSSRKMLEVLDQDAKLISYDNTVDPSAVSKSDPRLTFMHKSQDEFEPVDNIDFVFLDASHELEKNETTFKQILPHLRAGAIIAVHDTGTWKENYWKRDVGYGLPNGHWVHCPDEIHFVNWIKQEYPQIQQIHFVTTTKIRHGMTLLQTPLTLEV